MKKETSSHIIPRILIASVFVATALLLVPHSTHANEEEPTLEQNFEQGTVIEIEEQEQGHEGLEGKASG